MIYQATVTAAKRKHKPHHCAIGQPIETIILKLCVQGSIPVGPRTPGRSTAACPSALWYAVDCGGAGRITGPKRLDLGPHDSSADVAAGQAPSAGDTPPFCLIRNSKAMYRAAVIKLTAANLSSTAGACAIMPYAYVERGRSREALRPVGRYRKWCTGIPLGGVELIVA